MLPALTSPPSSQAHRPSRKGPRVPVRALRSTTARASAVHFDAVPPRGRAAVARPNSATPSLHHAIPCSAAPRTQGNERRTVEGAPSSRRIAPSPRGCDLQHLGLGFEPLACSNFQVKKKQTFQN